MTKPDTVQVLTDELYWLCEVMEQDMHHSKLGPTYIAAKGRFKLTRDPYEAARFIDRELCHAVCVAAHSQAHLYVKAVEHGFSKLAEKAEPPGCDHCLGGKVDAGGTAHDCDYPNCINFTHPPTDTALLEAAEKVLTGFGDTEPVCAYNHADWKRAKQKLRAAIKAHKGKS